MLPLTLQFVIVMVASAINERMRRKLDYALEENRILKEALRAATGTERIHFTPDQRRRLALAGKELTPKERRQCGQIVKPATILAWFRQLAARKYDSSRRKTGRPRKPRDIRELVIEMALANEGWGYTKIRDALVQGLKIEIGRSTVADILGIHRALSHRAIPSGDWRRTDQEPAWFRERQWVEWLDCLPLAPRRPSELLPT